MRNRKAANAMFELPLDDFDILLIKGNGSPSFGVKVAYTDIGFAIHQNDRLVMSVEAAEGMIERLQKELAHSRSDLYNWAMRKTANY